MNGEKRHLRVLRFLAAGSASVRPASSELHVLLEAAGRGTIATESAVLGTLVGQGLLVRTSHSIALSSEGAAIAAHLQSSLVRIQDKDHELDLVSVETGSGPALAIANLSESPLAQLARRKGRDGKPFLCDREFRAGERLRSDYTRGQIMPRLGANWGASVSSGRRTGGGAVELSDAALSARQRVDNAIAAVGPELSGVLVDICCFLKGLELVETERGWPVRSAKIVLKTALGVLGRHYWPGEDAARHNRHKLVHWGAQDYRPALS